MTTEAEEVREPVIERLPKKNRRSPVDLTAKGWFKPLLEEVIEEYEDGGWKVLSTAKARENLKASTFAREDYRRLKLGFGLKIGAPCGCEWLVGFKDGAWEREKKCDNEECSGYPPAQPKPEEKPVMIEKRPLVSCWDCGGNMAWSKKKAQYFCPRCRH